VEGSIDRVTRSVADARRTYDRLSGWYDLLERPWERQPCATGLTLLAAQHGETILEIGFGTGHALVAMAREVGARGAAHGLDLSGGMLAQARARLLQAELTNRVRLVLGDAARLPYRNGCFDAVFMSFTLELFDTPQIAAVLRECRRVLRDGGRLGVVSLAKRDPEPLTSRAYTWLHRRFPAYLDCRPIYVQQALDEAQFRIGRTARMNIWGLPVDAVVATMEH